MMCAGTLTTESEGSRVLTSCQIEVMMLKCFIMKFTNCFNSSELSLGGVFW